MPPLTNRKPLFLLTIFERHCLAFKRLPNKIWHRPYTPIPQSLEIRDIGETFFANQTPRPLIPFYDYERVFPC